jgi:hypothetical protein
MFKFDSSQPKFVAFLELMDIIAEADSEICHKIDLRREI